MTASGRPDNPRRRAGGSPDALVCFLLLPLLLEPCAAPGSELGPPPQDMTNSEAGCEALPDPNMKSVFLFPSFSIRF